MTWTDGPTMPLSLISTLFRRTIFDKKMFNEHLSGFEETELFATLLYRKILFVYVPILAFTYRIHDSNTTKDHRRLRIAYIQFLEAMHKLDPALVHLSPRIGTLIHQAFISGDREVFDLIISLIKKTNVPFSFIYKSIKTSNPLALQLLFFLRKFYISIKNSSGILLKNSH